MRPCCLESLATGARLEDSKGVQNLLIFILYAILLQVCGLFRKQWQVLSRTGLLRLKNKSPDTDGLAGVKHLQQQVSGSGLAAACTWHQVTL